MPVPKQDGGSYNKKLEEIVAENLKAWPRSPMPMDKRVHPADALKKKRKRLSAKQAATRAIGGLR